MITILNVNEIAITTVPVRGDLVSTKMEKAELNL